MLLQPPKVITWFLALVLGVLGILIWPQVGVVAKPDFIALPAATLAFWLEAAAFVLLSLAGFIRAL